MKTTKISILIERYVENYRHAAIGYRTNKENNSGRAFQMMMDKASGALDALFDLDPGNKSWTETGWIS